MAFQIGTFQYLFSRLLYLLFMLTGPFLLLHDNMDQIGDRINVAINGHEETFDFIVAGAGSAGIVVATRLSENFKVLLLEAGGEPYSGTFTPGNSLALLNRPVVDWQFKTVPQKKSCLAMNEQKSVWHRGKGLGGSSNLNYMMYARGPSEDYNNWANITGDQRWAYKNVLKYFKKSENFLEDLGGDSNKYHGKDGPMSVRYADYMGMADYFVEAGKQLGYPEIDYNSEFHKEGFSKIQYTMQKSGYRGGTFHSFLTPIRSTRTNLSVYKFAFVNKVLFKEGTNEITGVEYSRHGQNYVAYAKYEVILSAGAIGSPKILMASGIGPKEHLQSLGIEVKKDLPVGKNLQDHIATLVGPFIVNESISYNMDRDHTPSAWTDLYFQGKGVLTSTGIVATGSTSSERVIKEGFGHWADLQYVNLNAGVSDGFSALFEYALNIKDGVLEKYYEQAKNKDSFFTFMYLSRPKGRGEILLSSTDPKDPPLIDPKYFENDSDMKTFIEGIKFAIKMVEETKVFQDMDGYLLPVKFPGCEEHEFRSDEYFECFARHFSLTVWHYCGTCSMGKENSKTAVVNSKLQVIGIQNLRVMDGSVMPEVVSMNTNAPIIMVGELGSDLLKEKYLKGGAKKDSKDKPDRQEL